LARDGQAHIRWFDAQGPDEAQGSHHKQKEARSWQEGVQESCKGGLQAKEGHVQAFQGVSLEKHYGFRA